MFTLVLRLISYVLICLTFLLNKSVNHMSTIINASLVHAYKIYSSSVSLVVSGLLPLFRSFLYLQMVVGKFISLNLRGTSNFR